MTKKKKEHVPRDMGDLEEIFYGPNKDGRNVNLNRQKRYLDYLRTQVLSPRAEEDAKKIFAPLGKIEKIPETKKQTSFDYKIDDRRLLLEITSLNVDETYPTNLTRMDVLKKLKDAIDHILAKDASPFPGYRKGGAIVYTLIFNFFSKFHELLDDKLPETSEMFKNDLDFLVFLPDSASINNKNSREVFPTVFYVRNESLTEEFKKAFQGQNYKIVMIR